MDHVGWIGFWVVRRGRTVTRFARYRDAWAYWRVTLGATLKGVKERG